MTREDGDEHDNNDNENAAGDNAMLSAQVEKASADAGGGGEYAVVLDKGVCGFGIYFTAAADGVAMVDPAQPFYRLPDGSQAPGEASGLIQPGDRLLAINDTSVASHKFQDVVEELRRTPLGGVTLRFERVKTTAVSGKEDQDQEKELQQRKSVRWKLFDWQQQPTSGAVTAKATVASPYEEEMLQAAAMEELLLEMENKIRLLEEDVEREKKCRFLAEKKNILYRNALRSLSDDNAQLRYQLTLEKHAHDATQRFQNQKLHLSI